MRILFLNTWNGSQPGFQDYIASEASHTHIFCFQEAYKEMRENCADLLSGYTESTGYKELTSSDNFPRATYIREDLDIKGWEYVLPEMDGVGLGIYTEVISEGVTFHICNFHGKAYPGDKLDDPQRLAQSDGILDFFSSIEGPKIIGGDFNLEMETESVKKFEGVGYRNLIREYQVRTTRNRLVWEKYPDTPQYHSDYVFVSPDVRVKEFFVPEVLVSDHQPLVLEVGG
jgi:endonuclease/exonuclease/phosphatase (EEP) superfamily protein YafD